MPHFICRWPGGDVLLASVESRQELDAILQERCEPGVCKVARYHGPLVLELKPNAPGVPRASAEQFTPGTACPAFEPAWGARASSGDVDLVAADGSSQRVHKLVLQCRLPVLRGEPVAAEMRQVRLDCVPDGISLFSLVQFLYLDDIQDNEQLTPQLHQSALACGVHRLVQLCEAHYAQLLELQLTSWIGLYESQREGVLDSFIGWARYAEQLHRLDLRNLCIHALARHLAAAQNRPSWSLLSPASSSLARIIAASTAPPLVHRQVAPDGTAVLPVPSNPPPTATAEYAAGPTVSVDAEALAAAGGRLTSAEWLQLQGYRSAVAESLKTPAACPIAINQQQLSSWHPASGSSPGIVFTVKPPVLGPHKRLMDSVWRFAFPATHTLTSSGWQIPLVALSNSVANSSNPVGQSHAAATVATPTAAPASAACRAGLLASGQTPSTTASFLGEPLTPSTAPSTTADLASTSARAGVHGSENSSQNLLPVPVPVLIPVPVAPEQGLQQPAGPATSAAAVTDEPPAAGGNSHGSCGARVSVQLCEQASLRSSHTGSIAGHVARMSSSSSGIMLDSSADDSPAGHHLRIRVLSAGEAGQAGRRSSHIGRLRSDLRQSWGSGVSPVSTEGPEQLQQQPQSGTAAIQLVPSAALPPAHLHRALREPTGLLSSWGSGTVHRQSSVQSSQQPMNGDPHQQHIKQQQVGHLSHLSTTMAEQLPEPGGLRVMQQHASDKQQESEHSNNMQVELSELSAVGQEVEQGQHQGDAVAEQSRNEHRLAQATNSDLLLVLPAHRELHADAAAGPNELNQTTHPPGVTGTAAVDAAAWRPHGLPPIATTSPAVPGHAGGSPCPVATLQRALVEDFVLYEEASAARQHVVGILVAIEQGDVVAGQRLLAPACADLIAATAPAPAPNKLAAFIPATAAIGAIAPSGDESAAAAAAVRAAEKYLNSVKGINKLLGMASNSRAATQPTAGQQQQQQQQLIRALQRLGAHLPGLSRLLATHPIAATTVAAAATTSNTLAEGLLQHASSAGDSATTSAHTAHNSISHDLNAAVTDLLQLPVLLQSLQQSVLLTQEQFMHRQQQLQQLVAQAAAMLTQQASGAYQSAAHAAPAAAALAGNYIESVRSLPLLTVSASEASQMRERGFQAGVLFSSILASLGTAGAVAQQVPSTRLGPGAVQYSTTGIITASIMQGEGAVLLGYPYSSHAGAGGAGMFTPTGVGALLAGGLLAEGGVAGDSILEDTAADALLHGAGARRITCNGLYELCATLARPAGSPAQDPGVAALGQHAVNAMAVQNSPSLSGRKRRLSSAEEQQPAAKR